MSRRILIAFTMAVVGCVQADAVDTHEQHVEATRILLPAGGTGQAHEVMTPFERPLGVYVDDVFGDPVEGAIVQLDLPATGASGTLGEAGVAITDAEGFAQLAVTADSVAGLYTIVARTDGAAPISFVLRNLPSTPEILFPIGGTAQAGRIGTAFARPLVVALEDRYGNPVPGIEVAFTAPTTGATATLGSSRVTTDAEGHASVTAIAGTISGTYAVEASCAGSTIEFVLANREAAGLVSTHTWAGLDPEATVTMQP